MSYENKYHVLTWGGFYNDEHKAKHGLEEGDFLFDTDAERQAFIAERNRIADELNAHFLCIRQSEGYCCETRTVLHRVCEFNGKKDYSTYDLGINYPYTPAMYHLVHKWYPGFNHYPFGDDVDYQSPEFKVLGEWITGAFEVGGE